MYIRTTGIIGRACAIRIDYQKWLGTSINSTDPLHFEFQFWCSWMLASWSYSFPNVMSESSKDQKIAWLYFWTPFHVASLRQLWASYRQLWEAPWPCCYAAPDSHCRSRFGHWEVSLNVNQVSLSLSGFLHIFSVDSSNHYPGLRCRIQWNVQVLRSTVVFIQCMIIEIQLFYQSHPGKHRVS